MVGMAWEQLVVGMVWEQLVVGMAWVQGCSVHVEQRWLENKRV